jgi:DNA-binding NarL/FixJ family response regulator
MKIRIGIVDDHQLFLKSLGFLICSLPNFELAVDALNGVDLLEKLKSNQVVPDILLIDVNMPRMDGVDTARNVNLLYPQIKMAALSMKDDDTTIIKMLQAGCTAYLLKDIHPNELEIALLEINEKGYYNADKHNVNHRRFVARSKDQEIVQLTLREKEFLRLACSDLTYKQVAMQMSLAERTIDGYREALFEKLNVKSRVGMALEAIRRNLVLL